MKRREFIALGAATLATGCAGVARRINHERSLAMYEVIIIGGSFAGLAAALQLGRARRKVTVLDTGVPRNRFAGHSHGLLGHDHRPPLEILAEARQQLARYPTVKLVNARADSISGPTASPAPSTISPSSLAMGKALGHAA
jgi:NADPH-dependent 2,4-dienoyl-CoA reductase/sulfur reductase-like enzyme